MRVMTSWATEKARDQQLLVALGRAMLKHNMRRTGESTIEKKIPASKLPAGTDVAYSVAISLLGRARPDPGNWRLLPGRLQLFGDVGGYRAAFPGQ